MLAFLRLEGPDPLFGVRYRLQLAARRLEVGQGRLGCRPVLPLQRVKELEPFLDLLQPARVELDRLAIRTQAPCQLSGLFDQGLRFELPYQERLWRVGQQLARRMHENDMQWWDNQLAEYQPLPVWKDFPKLWETELARIGGKPEDFPFWLLTSRSMQYAWGGNVGLQIIHEVAGNVAGHGGVIINAKRAEALGIADGDPVEIATPAKSVRAKAVLRQGIRPDTLLLIAQFDHWATPYAKDFGVPSMNSLVPMSMNLTDATGSGADVVRVSIKRTPRT